MISDIQFSASRTMCTYIFIFYHKIRVFTKPSEMTSLRTACDDFLGRLSEIAVEYPARRRVACSHRMVSQRIKMRCRWATGCKKGQSGGVGEPEGGSQNFAMGRELFLFFEGVGSVFRQSWKWNMTILETKLIFQGPRHHHVILLGEDICGWPQTSQIVIPHFLFLLFVPLSPLSSPPPAAKVILPDKWILQSCSDSRTSAFTLNLRPDDVPMFSAKQDAATTGFRSGNGKAWICRFGAAWCPKNCGFRLHLVFSVAPMDTIHTNYPT